MERGLLRCFLPSACKCILRLLNWAYVLFSLSASLTVNLWSDVGITAFAGVLTSFVLVFAPYRKHFVVRMVFAGSYLGSIVWVLKKVVKYLKGQNVTGSW
jgi:hypothetical protein